MVKKRNVEIEHPNIKEIEHKVEHPDLDDDSLRDADFSPGENEYLNEGNDIPYS